ncbi:MAG: DUF512 domain-containing protein [Oscillospiraceae bacterium]|nr:DUF512 domain-containing protein [Oscillospiraceae bacterium]
MMSDRLVEGIAKGEGEPGPSAATGRATRHFTVTGLEAGGLAEALGVRVGDVLLSVNGSRPKDIFDYGIVDFRDAFSLELDRDGSRYAVDAPPDAGRDDVGISFSGGMEDGERGCRNACIFCFVDQLPGGMRESLYFKDDDVRLSFLEGNYVTLTNVDDAELDRIARLRMSPINVSVHSTDLGLRRAMMGNAAAPDVAAQIKRLCSAEITVNCQIILCKGINDGDALRRTVDDLAAMHPGVGGVSVAPAGITRFRDGLYGLGRYDFMECAGVLRAIKAMQKKCLRRIGTRFVFPADEWFYASGMPYPRAKAYEGFAMLDNGVGMAASFLHDLRAALAGMGGSAYGPALRLSAACGMAAAPLLRKAAALLRRIGAELTVYPVANAFFGETVTVSGLMTGGDIMNTLSGADLGDGLLLPMAAFRADGLDPDDDGKVMLDGTTLGAIRGALACRVDVVGCGGGDLARHVRMRLKGGG